VAFQLNKGGGEKCLKKYGSLSFKPGQDLPWQRGQQVSVCGFSWPPANCQPVRGSLA